MAEKGLYGLYDPFLALYSPILTGKGLILAGESLNK
jgi:hypothetical protein